MQMTGLDYKIMEMAARIRELREISHFTPEEMAAKTDTDVATYLNCERYHRRSQPHAAVLYTYKTRRRPAHRRGPWHGVL